MPICTIEQAPCWRSLWTSRGAVEPFTRRDAARLACDHVMLAAKRNQHAAAGSWALTAGWRRRARILGIDILGKQSAGMGLAEPC
jgi:hypothetical protein